LLQVPREAIVVLHDSSTDVSTAVDTAIGAALGIHARLSACGVNLPVRLWDGRELGPPDAGFRVVLAAPHALRALLLRPTDLAAGEAYAFGDIDIEGDIVAALHTATMSRRIPQAERVRLARLLTRLPRPPRRPASRRARLRGRAHSLQRDRAAVQFHYDVGNDFFATFLDENLVYSCAYFTDADDDLGRAQLRKLDLICRKLHLRPGERFLDVGCGWGSLAMHAARRYGVRVVGVTLSTAQHELARARVAEAGLADRVDIRLQDYREVDGRFDAIASVGMVEHVGARQLPGYFEQLYRLLARGGRCLNHGITTGRRRVVRDFSSDATSFIGAYVFPDGALVPAGVAVQRMEEAGFEIHDVEQLRPHYARTLRHWVRRLERNAEAAIAATSELDYRIWRAYMAGSAVSFESGDLGVVQILGTRGALLPLDRAWMMPQLEQIT
jgi:cyclopropane-fatty-acyl-phospholipid synthase